MSQLNADARPDQTARHRSAPSRVLTGSLYVVVAAVLTQAILAGLFISATAEARLAHLIVGSLLPWFAIIPAVSAFRDRRILDQRVVTGAILLPVALWVQEALGHMPFAVSTAVHVPLGVAIFGSSVVLALAAGQATRSRSASPPGAASGG